MLFANVCARFISSCYGEFVNNVFFLDFVVSSRCLVHMGSTCFVVLPSVYKTWVTLVCLLLDTLLGRRSVGALPLLPPGRVLQNS